ncbi:MAG TPA: TIGR03936 family radical SAM-associated protein [Acidimicrobiales bacterium]
MPDGAAGCRIRFTKLGRIRFTSQRDVARMWERALRRSALEVAWSAGFSPRPLLSFGLALPTGCESTAEYLDVRLDHAPRPGALDPAALGALLPDGLEVTRTAVLPDGGSSLQQEVSSCTWELEVHGVTHRELKGRIERALDAPSLPVRRERKGRLLEDDLRPLVLSLSATGPLAGPVEPRADEAGGPAPTLGIGAELATRPRGVRPMELLTVLGPEVTLVRARRTTQWIESDGGRSEPLPLEGEPPGAVVPHAAERAS